MDLSRYFEEHPKLKQFDPAKDQSDVLELFTRSPMNVAGIELVYDRSPDFSRLIQCQGSDSISVLAQHHEKKIAVASISTEKRWLHGKVENVGYVGDFRTDRSRAAAWVWRQHYASLLAAFAQNSGPTRHFLTAVLGGNEEAVKNLTHPHKSFGLRYDLLCQMDMVNIYSRLPWSSKPQLQTVRAQASDQEELIRFIFEREKEKAFGIYFDSALWQRRSQSWTGFSIENFLLQKNREGHIVACTLPWNPGFAKRMKVQRAPFALQALFKGLSFLGFSLPRVGESLETIYLTHLNRSSEIDAKDSVESFLYYLFQHGPGAHFISFADPSGFSKSMKGWISQKVEVRLYSVVPTTDPKLDLRGQEISFEMGLV